MIGVIYQPSHKNAEEMEYIEKMDPVLSSMKSTFNSSVILTRDTTIDLLSSSMARDMYKQLLNTYQLSCHVTKRTRHDKTLINNISSNSNKIKVLHSANINRQAYN